jgi:hypothetical protein
MHFSADILCGYTRSISAQFSTLGSPCAVWRSDAGMMRGESARFSTTGTLWRLVPIPNISTAGSK